MKLVIHSRCLATALCAVTAAAFVAVPLPASAKPRPHEPGQPTGSPDLVGVSITFKTKADATTTTLNNAKFVAKNQGDAKAANSVVQFFVSDDNVLSTETDTLIHQVDLGAVQKNKTKKRTVGGGHFAGQSMSGKRVIAVLDALEQIPESDENNNVFVSDPLP